MLIEVALEIPAKIVAGLASGQLERVGGVVRDASSKQIVMWLREGGQIASNPNLASGFLSPLLNASSGGLLSAATGVANMAVTARSHHLIMQQLNGISRMLGVVGGIGVVNIAVSVVSMGAIMSRLSAIQKQIEWISAELDRDRDAKLQAGLEAAKDASVAVSSHNRLLHAKQAIARLREARLQALDDLNKRLASGASPQLAEQLAKAMQVDLVFVRCYMEIDDIANAKRHLVDAVKTYRQMTVQCISMLLGLERAIYFHPSVSDEDLWRLVAVLQWQSNRETTPEAVMVEALLANRHDFWNQDLLPEQGEPDRLQFVQNLLSRGSAESAEGSAKHLDALEQADSLIESHDRLHGLLIEIEAIERLGVSNSEWEARQRIALAGANIQLDEHEDYVALVDQEALRRLKTAA